MSPSVGQTYIPNPLSFFKKNQIDVKLEKYAYTPGETIKGSVGLKLKRPLPAKKLMVGLIGLRIVHQGNIAVGPVRVGNQGSQTQVYTIYNFEIPLDEEAVYYHELYPFEIQIPLDILQSAQQNFQFNAHGPWQNIRRDCTRHGRAEHDRFTGGMVCGSQGFIFH